MNNNTASKYEYINNESSEKELKKILVIDDDKYIGIQIKTAVKGSFEVKTESRASRAVLAAEEESPAAILLDLHMPNVDGYEVLAQLKKHPMTSRIPVICLSGDDSSHSRERAKNLGATSFLKKPLDLKNLKDDVKSLISSIHISLISKNKRKRFDIAFNDNEKYRLIKESIFNGEQSEKILFLSWLEGDEFFQSDSELETLNTNHITYLKLKPTLITKFPYMQDLSPIINDIKSFLENKSNEYILVFDEPSLILNLYDPESALAKSYMLWQVLFHEFSKVYCFCGKTGDEQRDILLNQIARAFIGNEKR
ncbi:MAG: response regulator [Flavobacteriaceae bacterium]|nr:response regulator [Flavobacteriaceae bacterium]